MTNKNTQDMMTNKNTQDMMTNKNTQDMMTNQNTQDMMTNKNTQDMMTNKNIQVVKVALLFPHSRGLNGFTSCVTATYFRLRQEDLAKHDICADHRRSMLLPKRQRQIDFVTVNDHVNSAIIGHMRTVLTQAMHRLPTAKNAFMRKPSRSVR
ncbi:hypothetical protein LSAT2_002594 [Lamellibrachia satsuma]|nr:hypothetical protein LSAT2_002594 [Lamellibrachia satsuma]